MTLQLIWLLIGVVFIFAGIFIPGLVIIFFGSTAIIVSFMKNVYEFAGKANIAKPEKKV